MASAGLHVARGEVATWNLIGSAVAAAGPRSSAGAAAAAGTTTRAALPPGVGSTPRSRAAAACRARAACEGSGAPGRRRSSPAQSSSVGAPRSRLAAPRANPSQIANPALEGGWGGGGPPIAPGGGGSGGGSGDGDGASGGAGKSNSGEGFWAWYCMLVEKYPMVTKGVTAGLLNVIADLFCQLVVEKSSTVDIQRTLGFAAIGLFVVGPLLHIWYGLLPQLITMPGNNGTLLRLFVDQVVFAPLSLVGFMAIVLTLEGRPGDVVPKLKKDLLSTVIAQWKLWLPFQYLNFRFCPPSLQVATAGLVGLAWTVYISAVSHSNLPSKQAGSSETPPKEPSSPSLVTA